MESLSEKLFDFLYSIPRSYYLPIVLLIGGLIFLSIGMIQLIGSKNSQDTVQSNSQTSPTSLTPPTVLGIQVDVEGAVVHPGVYKLAQNARVQDALIAAGGMSASANREVVAKSLNLAAKVTDGVKIYVPNIGEQTTENRGQTAEAGIQTGTVLGATTGLININSASASQLDSLPGIGSVTSAKIINARPYGSVDELLSKKVVSSSVFTKIKDKVTAF